MSLCWQRSAQGHVQLITGARDVFLQTKHEI